MIRYAVYSWRKKKTEEKERESDEVKICRLSTKESLCDLYSIGILTETSAF